MWDKMYRNGRGGQWTCRILWFSLPKGKIRLKMETLHSSIQVEYDSEVLAQSVWDAFRKRHPMYSSTNDNLPPDDLGIGK